MSKITAEAQRTRSLAEDLSARPLRPLRLCGFLFFFSLLASGGCEAPAADRPSDSLRSPRRRSEEELRAQLLMMAREDQELRRRAVVEGTEDPAVLGELRRTDALNATRMRDIIDEWGWPGARVVGVDAARAAWLLVQHADADRDLQKRCLDLMAAADAADVAPADLALLTDRVLVGEGKKQVYGSQFRLENGALAPYPIEDEAHVDERRKAVGLPPIAEYRKTLEDLYLKKKKATTAESGR